MFMLNRFFLNVPKLFGVIKNNIYAFDKTFASRVSRKGCYSQPSKIPKGPKHLALCAATSQENNVV